MGEKMGGKMQLGIAAFPRQQDHVFILPTGI